MFEVDKNKDSAYPIFHQVPVIGVTEDFHIGRAGKVALNLYQEGKMTFDKAMELLQYDYGIAYKRMFGSAKFDLVFIYDLADPEMLLALSFMPVDKKMFYLSDAAYQKLQDGDQFFLDAVKYALPKMGRVYVNTKEKANCLKKICNVNVLLQRGNRAKDLGNQIYRYINPKGIIQTHALSSQRKQTEKRRREESALYEEIIGAICNGKTLQECSENIQKYISSLNNNVSLDLDSYNTKLAKLCVNHLLPDVYEEKSNSPIKNKIVFLYPKDDKSLFLQYLYNEYVNEGDAKALLYELDQEQDALDLYGEMVSVVKEMADSNKVYVYGLDDLINHINFREETEITNVDDSKELKRVCIKEILPEVYQRYCGRPLRNKAVFLQPREGVNQSFLYIYNKIKEEQLYDVSFHELHRGEVEDCEYYCNAIDFVKDIATAKVVFEHESNNLLGYVDIRPETKIIQLWHGCGIFKKIGLDTYGKPGYKTMEEYEEYPEYNKYSLVTIASPELSWVYEQFMGIDKESGIIQPIGVSRTDEFFDESYIKNCYDKLYERIPQAREKKVILYAPTYRGLGRHRVSPDELNVKQFADALSDDYILIFKHHQTAIDLPEIPEEYRDKFAFDMTRGRGMNINELLTVADICISDYSSLVFEYSLFERPIMFFVYDLEEYMDNRGLYYDFDEITPGPLCKTNEEMIEYIKHIDERFDKEAVTDFKNRFMCACDGHSTERILKFIEQ